MKKHINIFLAIACVLMFSACSKDDIDTFNQGYDAVRFVSNLTRSELQYLGGNAYSTNDDVLFSSYSFVDDAFATEHEVDLRLVLIGKSATYDRNVDYEVSGNVPDSAYTVEESVIPADSIYGHIRVKLFNSEYLNDSTYELTIRLKGNNELKAGPEDYISARLSWNNQIPAPSHRDHIRTYNMLIAGMRSPISTSLSAFSPNALRAIVAATGWNDWDDANVHGIRANDANRFYYKYLPRYTWIYVDGSYRGYQAKVKDWLEQYKQTNGTPLLHDAGALKGRPVQAREGGL